MHAPTSTNMEAVERILKYLKGSPGQGIWMKRNNNHEIVGYSDADWAGDPIERKSTTGYCTFVGGNIVTWKSKKQSVVARSSAEAEYRAMATTTCELVWLKALVQDLGFSTSSPMKLYCDNQAAIHIASNPVFHERTKHIEVDCHFIRQKVQQRNIVTPYVRSEEQLADIFTKGTTGQALALNLSKLGCIDIYKPNLRGSVEIETNKETIAQYGNSEAQTTLGVQEISSSSEDKNTCSFYGKSKYGKSKSCSLPKWESLNLEVT